MIVIETFKGKGVSDHRVEIVERKGTGHPDFICDAVMDAISVALSGAYLREFGAILHHNIDKGLLAAGRVEKWYGGGRVLQPMELTIRYRPVLAPGSAELTDIFARPGGVLSANDTSAAVGYYPLSPTEQVVLELERHLNSVGFKAAFPDTGEDVKEIGRASCR